MNDFGVIKFLIFSLFLTHVGSDHAQNHNHITANYLENVMFVSAEGTATHRPQNHTQEALIDKTLATAHPTFDIINKRTLR